MTTLSANTGVTLTVAATDMLLIDCPSGGRARVEAISGVAGASTKKILVEHRGARRKYGPFGAGTISLGALEEDLRYAVGQNPQINDTSEALFSYNSGQQVTGFVNPNGGSAISNVNELYSNYEGMTHTGTTAETILYSVLIPGGTIVAPASLEHFLRFQITTTSDAGSRAVRTYLNTENSLSGATAMGDMFHSTISVTYSYLRPGDPIIFPTSTSQLGFPRGNGPNSLNSLAADRTGTLDTSEDMYFIVSATLINAADSLSVRGVRLMLNGER